MRIVACTCCLLLAGLTAPGCEFGVEQPVADSTAPATGSGEGLVRGSLRFVEGYQAGSAESSRQGKPMMLFFTAHWCQYCRQMAEESFTDPQVVHLSENFVCVLIDADAEPDVCRRFEVTGYPTLQFLSPRGVPLQRVVGKRPSHQVTLAMQQALQHVARRDYRAEPARH